MVKIKIVSDMGHTTLDLTPSEALSEIKTQTQENGKWCYIDGQIKSFDVLRLEDLEIAENIILVNQLKGG